MKYDDASWHSGGNFPKGLPEAAGATHIGMFVAWALLSGLAGDIHITDSPEELPRLRSRSLTPGQFFLDSCDGKFTNEDLNTEGNAFTQVYFHLTAGPYVSDYEATLGKNLADLYHVQDTWENFDRLRPVLDLRFAEWKASGVLLPTSAFQREMARPAASTLKPMALWCRFLIAMGATVAILFVAAAVFLPTFDVHGRRAANEVAALGGLRRINQLESDYAVAHPAQGFVCQLAQLKPQAVVGDNYDPDAFLLTGEQGRYKFLVISCSMGAKGAITQYQITAVPLEPGKSGFRTFCSDQSSGLWYDSEGSAEKCLVARNPI